MALYPVLVEIFQKPTVIDVITELMFFVAPLWVAVLVGVLVGWAWKPEWANFNGHARFSGKDPTPVPTSFSPSGFILGHLSSFLNSLYSLNFKLPIYLSWMSNNGVHNNYSLLPPSDSSSGCSLLNIESEKSRHVDEDDLKHLVKLTEEKDGGPVWIQMMERSTPSMSYQAWRRDPDNGPPQYRTRTVYEDATPELLRDYFWDDEFRLKWDDMLIHAQTLEECPTTGSMMVQWVRKFPFFCSDREYIIARRIWESGNMFYCVTKVALEVPQEQKSLEDEIAEGVPCSALPRRQKPRRVDLYYSSWCIRAVESKRDGQLSACEVLLFHHEDMGIPWEIAKLGVRQGMWGAVKKIDPGIRAYQKQRASGLNLSHCASMAQINTKVTENYLKWLESSSNANPSEVASVDPSEKPLGRTVPKFLVLGGAIALACTLDRGLLTKAVIFGVARRLVRIGKRL